MPHSDLPFRALSVLHTSRYLFNKYGFHKVGVDRIIESSKTPKATFYHYFHYKERFIEICLTVQKERLKEKVISIAEDTNHTSAIDKLKALYFLHTDLEGHYYLLFKAIFETELTYPKAYQTAVRYRTWLINEIYSQLRLLKTDVSFQDAKLFLYMIEGAIIQLLSSDVAIEREKVLDCFLMGLKTHSSM